MQKGPEALEDAYRDALERIDSQLESHRSLARRALSWVMYTRRPLTTEELRHALATELGDSSFDHDNLDDLGEIISVCAGLLTAEQESGIVRLVHYTTQDYFERKMPSWNPGAKREIAEICLTYLSFEHFQTGRAVDGEALEQRFKQYSLLPYVAGAWPFHVEPVERSVLELVLGFLRYPKLIECADQAFYCADEYLLGLSIVPKFEKEMKGLHVAARYGLYHVTQRLLSDASENGKADVDSTDGSNETPLIYASQYGHEKIAELLINHAADVNAEGDMSYTPLQTASACGHEEVVKLLICKGADVKGDWLAFRGAANLGHWKIARLLLDHGIDVGVYSALEHASDELQVELVGHLLQSGVKVNVLGRGQRLWYNAVFAALNGASEEEEVMSIFEAGADFDLTGPFDGGELRNPLGLAARFYSAQLVQLMVDKGADINAESLGSETALHAAVEGDREQTVQFLLENGADINAKSGGYGTALHRASQRGNTKVMKLLLLNGADVHAWDGRDGEHEEKRQQQQEQEREAIETIEFLDRYGRESFGTALFAASRNGHEEAVKLLLEHGADVNTWAGRRGKHTALYIASQNGHEQVVSLLLENGANVNLCSGIDGKDGTALSIALKNNHEKIAKLLRDKGAV